MRDRQLRRLQLAQMHLDSLKALCVDGETRSQHQHHAKALEQAYTRFARASTGKRRVTTKKPPLIVRKVSYFIRWCESKKAKWDYQKLFKQIGKSK